MVSATKSLLENSTPQKLYCLPHPVTASIGYAVEKWVFRQDRMLNRHHSFAFAHKASHSNFDQGLFLDAAFSKISKQQFAFHFVSSRNVR